MSSSRSQLSVSERLGLILNVFRTVCGTFFALLKSPFRGVKGHRELSKHVIHSALRRINSLNSANQIQNISPSTDEMYTQLAKTKEFAPVTIDLPFEAKAHWFGKQDAENITVWFHGGGYVFPASTQGEFLWDVQQKAPDTAAVLLSYSLAPGKQYPHQLIQAVALIRYLLSQGKKPENITVGGDSAGANLALAVFSHILRPHSSVDRLTLDSPFRGAVLISPWVLFECSAQSYAANGYKCCCNETVLKRWSSYFQGLAPIDEYNQPLVAPENWWSGLPEVVSSIFITAGSDETPFSDQKAFVEKLRVSYPKVETLFAAGETHDQVFMDPLIGVKAPCESRKAVEDWVVSKISGPGRRQSSLR